MRALTIGLLVAGIGLFAFLLAQADLAAVWGHVRRLGWQGAAVVLLCSCGWYVVDVLIWRQTFRRRPPLAGWFGRLWRAQVVGEALNNVTPLASLGGEPVKAALLHSRCGVSYREGVATLVIVQMINVTALVVFLVVGLVLILGEDALPGAVRAAASAGFGVMAVSVLLFFLVQRYRIVSRSGRWLGRVRLGARAKGLVRQIHRVEGHLVHFYRARPRRFALAVSLALVNWMLGAVEIYLVLWFLGHPIPVAFAWIIEAAVVLTRTALFVLPASIGAQEGVFYVVVGALTGSPALGIAVALIRRARELVWIGIGLALGAGVWLWPRGGRSRGRPLVPPMAHDRHGGDLPADPL